MIVCRVYRLYYIYNRRTHSFLYVYMVNVHNWLLDSDWGPATLYGETNHPIKKCGSAKFTVIYKPCIDGFPTTAKLLLILVNYNISLTWNVGP